MASYRGKLLAWRPYIRRVRDSTPIMREWDELDEVNQEADPEYFDEFYANEFGEDEDGARCSKSRCQRLLVLVVVARYSTARAGTSSRSMCTRNTRAIQRRAAQIPVGVVALETREVCHRHTRTPIATSSAPAMMRRNPPPSSIQPPPAPPRPTPPTLRKAGGTRGPRALAA